MTDDAVRKVFVHPMVLTEHVFDKVRAIDMTLAEFNELLTTDGEIIEVIELTVDQVKELVLYIEWTRPLHVVVHVDSSALEERIVTVYEPERARWSDDYRRRR